MPKFTADKTKTLAIAGGGTAGGGMPGGPGPGPMPGPAPKRPGA
jgi:hypothetical protein